MERKDKITLAAIAAGWLTLCLACSGGGDVPASAQPTPIPHPTHAANTPWTDPKIAKKVRNSLGFSDGWTTDEIKHENAEYQRQMDAYNKQQGVQGETKR